MLWNAGNDYGWQVDNQTAGANWTDALMGINSPGHANANTKGANTNMLNGIAEDCYGILIGFSGQSATTVARRCMVDLLIDPAAGVGNAGSSWSVIINNLYANSPTIGTTGCFGYWYFFPLYLKAGTAIGTAHQNLVAGTLPLPVYIMVVGKPKRPDLVKVGTKVQTLGATVASTTGTAVTPSTSNSTRSWSATLGTISDDKWWWQLGIGSNDTSMTARSYLFDVGANATNKILCMQGIPYNVTGSIEQASMGAMGFLPPYKEISSGQDVYVRGISVGGAPDSSMTAIVYALGG
jgi:hypothetical protein